MVYEPQLFVFYGLEIHRLLLSVLVQDSLLGLIFTLISFYRTGITLENKRGSLSFLVLLVTLSIVSNALHSTAMLVLSWIVKTTLLMDCSRGKLTCKSNKIFQLTVSVTI